MVILAVLIIATVVIYAIFAHYLTAARARLVGNSKTVETSFGTLEYAVLGEGEQVLVVHGAEGGFDQGIDMTGALAGRGYQLIVPSRFGYLRVGMLFKCIVECIGNNASGWEFQLDTDDGERRLGCFISRRSDKSQKVRKNRQEKENH